MRTVRQTGFGLSVALAITAILVGREGGAAAAGSASPSASLLQKIFARFESKGADIAFGGPIAVPLGMAPHGETLPVRELPPLRTKEDGVVHVFYRLDDGTGYVVVRFTEGGVAALRFDRDVVFVAAAVEPNGQTATALTGDAADKMLVGELHDWQTIVSGLPRGE